MQHKDTNNKAGSSSWIKAFTKTKPTQPEVLLPHWKVEQCLCLQTSPYSPEYTKVTQSLSFQSTWAPPKAIPLVSDFSLFSQELTPDFTAVRGNPKILGNAAFRVQLFPFHVIPHGSDKWDTIRITLPRSQDGEVVLRANIKLPRSELHLLMLLWGSGHWIHSPASTSDLLMQQREKT